MVTNLYDRLEEEGVMFHAVVDGKDVIDQPVWI